MENVVFGPFYDEKVDNDCEFFDFFTSRPLCEDLHHLNDSPSEGFDATSAKIMRHYA